MKTVFALILLSTLVGSQIRAEPAASPTNAVALTPDFLNQLAEEIRTNHPALFAAYARTNAAAANVQAVRTWEDPVARIGGMFARQDFRASDGDVLYGLDQKLPLFGKPQLARRVARAEFATESANADYQFQILRREFAKAAFRTAFADQVVVIGEQDSAWLDTLTRLAEDKVRTGQSALLEVIQLQNERAKRVNQLQTDREQLTHDHVSLNRFLNRDPQSPWPTLTLPPLAGPVVYSQRLVDFALKYEPKTSVMRQQIAQSEAVVNLTRRQRLPDVSVGVEARNYTGDGSFRQGALVLSMNLPWGNAGKYRSDIRREQEKLKAVEFDLADYEAGVREELHMLTVKIDAARRDALLYQDQIIPRTQSALELAQTGWQTGRNTFREMLDARRMLLDVRLIYVRAVAEQYQTLSELVLCCGLGDLGALQMIGAEPADTKP